MSDTPRAKRPALSGYAIKWDDQEQTWVARSQPEGLYVLRGRDQAELDAARRRLIRRLSDELIETTNGAAERGYSPPPT